MKNFQLLIIVCVIFCSFTLINKDKHTLYLIGDSTVANGNGGNGLWGWGKFIPSFFDTSAIRIRNYAVGGTSTRTFLTNGIWNPSLNKLGMWDTVYSSLKKGDYLLIQFGINDQSPVDDTSRSRGTLPGINNDSILIFNKVTHKSEVVHTYGWYLRYFINKAKEKGVTVIVCSSITKNIWKDGKVLRGENGFCSWALETAQQAGVLSIDLNNLIADIYDKEGEVAVTSKYHIGKDNTHTTEPGAILNATVVANAIKHLKNCKLKRYLK